MRLSSTLSNCVLKTSSDEDSTTSLGQLFQGLIVLTVKIIYFNTEIKPLPVQLVPVAPCLLHAACEKKASILFAAALYVLENCNEVPPSLLQIEKIQLLQFFFTGTVLQNVDHLCGPLQSICVFFQLGTKTGHSTPGVVSV